jgi:hypothetical protein
MYIMEQVWMLTLKIRWDVRMAPVLFAVYDPAIAIEPLFYPLVNKHSY